MTEATRSFARTWTVECLHCGTQFEQVGKRGRLRRTCSDECRDARIAFMRGEVRRGRYQALVDAGAFPAVAKAGCEGPRAFEATMAALKAGDPAPLGIARPERRKPVGRLRDIAKAPKALGGFNSFSKRPRRQARGNTPAQAAAQRQNIDRLHANRRFYAGDE